MSVLIRPHVVNLGAQLVFVDNANFENVTDNLVFRLSAGFAGYEREVIWSSVSGQPAVGGSAQRSASNLAFEKPD